MPKVTIWIREVDYAKWQSIESKPEFIHESLRHTIVIINENLLDFKELETNKLTPLQPAIAKASKVQPKNITIDTKGQPLKKAVANLCEHYQVKGQCLVKGCKYAR